MSTLHITNGDSAGDKLRRIVTGAVSITADPLHEGPAPPIDGDEWYDVRARFLANGTATHAEIKTTLASWDRAIVDGHRAGDIVLWFEHDLFDQLALIRTLDLLVRLKPDTTHEAATVRLKADTTYGGDASPDVVSGFSRTVGHYRFTRAGCARSRTAAWPARLRARPAPDFECFPPGSTPAARRSRPAASQRPGGSSPPSSRARAAPAPR
jgi:hypothetical protein